MNEPHEPGPQERLIQVLFGYILTRSVTTIAELGVPDVLADGPQPIDDLAKKVGANRDFETVPEGGDCYLLKHIIHDWDDTHCRQVLANIARVMDPAGRVLVVDMVVPDERVPHPSYFLDITMLAQTVDGGGRERTRQEFDALLASAGLKLEAIHSTPSPVSVVEASKA